VTADISPAKAVSGLDSDEMKHLFMA
jgi:hypothetical protein